MRQSFLAFLFSSPAFIGLSPSPFRYSADRAPTVSRNLDKSLRQRCPKPLRTVLSGPIASIGVLGQECGAGRWG